MHAGKRVCALQMQQATARILVLVFYGERESGVEVGGLELHL